MDQQQQQQDNNGFPQLGRQTSIYSLTLDEFQQTLCATGKNFGSMNMDEFLNSIWTAEENQAQVHPGAATAANNTSNNTANIQFSHVENASVDKGIARQPSLSRQGSLSLPAPLCRKTVEEVWSEIHKTQQNQQQNNDNAIPTTGASQREPTFGEMTLEDFLVRAGVVREQVISPQPIQQQPPYGMSYQNGNNPNTGPSFTSRPIMGVSGITTGGGSGGAGGVTLGGYQAIPHVGIGEAPGYVGSSKRASGYSQPAAAPACYGGRATNGTGGGYGQVQGLGLGSPVSPVSSDGMRTTQVDGYGLNMGGIRGGRKRIIDSPVGKVVERRQRRMIKNRESAARSRARKQAYTVELEAELNQLKEENAQLMQALAELKKKRNQQHFEEVKLGAAQSKAEKAKEKLKVLKRNVSCPY